MGGRPACIAPPSPRHADQSSRAVGRRRATFTRSGRSHQHLCLEWIEHAGGLHAAAVSSLVQEHDFSARVLAQDAIQLAVNVVCAGRPERGSIDGRPAPPSERAKHALCRVASGRTGHRSGQQTCRAVGGGVPSIALVRECPALAATRRACGRSGVRPMGAPSASGCGQCGTDHGARTHELPAMRADRFTPVRPDPASDGVGNERHRGGPPGGTGH